MISYFFVYEAILDLLKNRDVNSVYTFIDHPFEIAIITLVVCLNNARIIKGVNKRIIISTLITA